MFQIEYFNLNLHHLKNFRLNGFKLSNFYIPKEIIQYNYNINRNLSRNFHFGAEKTVFLILIDELNKKILIHLIKHY